MSLIIITLQDGVGEVGAGVQINVQCEPVDPGALAPGLPAYSAAGELASVALAAMRAHANAVNSPNN